MVPKRRSTTEQRQWELEKEKIGCPGNRLCPQNGTWLHWCDFRPWTSQVCHKCTTLHTLPASTEHFRLYEAGHPAHLLYKSWYSMLLLFWRESHRCPWIFSGDTPIWYVAINYGVLCLKMPLEWQLCWLHHDTLGSSRISALTEIMPVVAGLEQSQRSIPEWNGGDK